MPRHAEGGRPGFSSGVIVSADGLVFSDGDAPGVLRRAVPLWLNEPDLRALVVSYTQASPRHGGAGALYVRLRKSGR